MFTQTIPPEVFAAQREFCRVMDANRDFAWWAETLIAEETKELREAFEAEVGDMEDIFKEIGDLIYVVCGFYNNLPPTALELLPEKRNEEILQIIHDAAEVMSEVTQHFKIPLPVVVLCFEIVHASNMSKVNPETGLPDRREDGKILKGPNYVVPSMQRAVTAWQKFITKTKAKETLGDATTRH